MTPRIHRPAPGGQHELTNDQGAHVAGDPPPATVALPLSLAIAKEETEVYRRHLAKLVELWSAAGVMGFACRDSSKVPELLAHVELLRSILKR